MIRSSTSTRIIKWLAIAYISKTVVTVLFTYPDYFPPNFESDFLIGRNDYFYGPYRWAFYLHILSGPFSLVAGLVLISASFRQRFTTAHRMLGRIQIANILLLIAPSGLWMAWYAATGTVAALGFGSLAIATAYCAAKGWRAAVGHRFETHRRWMLRGYVLLCSAVVLRVIGGLSEVLDMEWTYPAAAWMCWLLPLALLEYLTLTKAHPTLRRQR